MCAVPPAEQNAHDDGHKCDRILKARAIVDGLWMLVNHDRTEEDRNKRN